MMTWHNTASLHARVGEVTARIAERSHERRARYLDRIEKAADAGPRRQALGCANQAHGFAACHPGDKAMLRGGRGPNLAIVTAYNDMLSAHQPYETYPEQIRAAARRGGRDGAGRRWRPRHVRRRHSGRGGHGALPLLPRGHRAVDGGLACRTRPTMPRSISASATRSCPASSSARSTFGHLPAVFIPAGPMTSGLPNDEKARIRQLFSEGKVSREALLEAEAASYHGPGDVHLLRHRQHEPDDDGDHGAAPARRLLRQSEHAAARCALTTRRRASRAMAITALGNDFTPGRADARRKACLRERHRRAACHGRLDQSHDAHRRHGGGGRASQLTWRRFLRPCRRRAAADARLSRTARRM